MDTIREVAKQIINSGAVSVRDVDSGEEPFVYSTGNRGPGYLMVKGIVGQPSTLKYLTWHLAQKVVEEARKEGKLIELEPETELTLIPLRHDLTILKFLFVRDENTRLLTLLRGDADAVLNGLSLPKTEWIRNKYLDRFSVFDREGVKVAYLAFNLKDPILSKKQVRKAIAAAIDREEIFSI